MALGLASLLVKDEVDYVNASNATVDALQRDLDELEYQQVAREGSIYPFDVVVKDTLLSRRMLRR